MSDYLKPIMNETDLLPYESFLNDISKTEKCDKNNSVLEKLIGKRISIKVSVDNSIYSYFGVLKKVEKEYLELCQNNGKKILILKPEKIISITII